VGRHPFERGKLVSSEPQNVLQLRRDLAPAARNQRRKPGIQRGPLPENSSCKLVRQTAVRLAEGSSLSRKRDLERLTVSNVTQNGQGCTA
jgi:hypothetical protein